MQSRLRSSMDTILPDSYSELIGGMPTFRRMDSYSADSFCTIPIKRIVGILNVIKLKASRLVECDMMLQTN